VLLRRIYGDDAVRLGDWADTALNQARTVVPMQIVFLRQPERTHVSPDDRIKNSRCLADTPESKRRPPRIVR